MIGVGASVLTGDFVYHNLGSVFEMSGACELIWARDTRRKDTL